MMRRQEDEKREDEKTRRQEGKKILIGRLYFTKSNRISLFSQVSSAADTLHASYCVHKRYGMTYKRFVCTPQPPRTEVMNRTAETRSGVLITLA